MAFPWIQALFRVLLVNVVPIWGFTQQDWTPGTILALYWLQTVATIPVTAALVILHRNLTHKAGHYRMAMTEDPDAPKKVRRSAFVNEFLVMSIPFAIAHGIFLAFVLGLVWKDAAGAIDPAHLRHGAAWMLGLLAIGFAVDAIGLRDRSFAWIQGRTTAVMQRTVLVHFVIIFGMGAAAFAKRDAETFFAVFLGLKLLFEIGAELPQWKPSGEAAPWFARLMNRMAAKPGIDFAAEWKKIVAEQRANAEIAERTIESLEESARAPATSPPDPAARAPARDARHPRPPAAR